MAFCSHVVIEVLDSGVYRGFDENLAAAFSERQIFSRWW